MHNLRFLVALTVISFSLSAKSQELAADVVDTTPTSPRLQLYSETYSSPFLTTPVNFQRGSYDVVRFGKKDSFKIFIAGERYADGVVEDDTAEIGIAKSFTPSFSALASVRREFLNDSEQTIWVARAGLVYSHFFDLSVPNTFADTYGELFLRAPQQSKAGVTASGWAKLGYRALATDHWSIDPLMIMFRAYDATDRSLLGADYQSLNLGGQLTFYTPHPEISFNLIAARAFTHTFTAPDEIVNRLWLLFAVGANF